MYHVNVENELLRFCTNVVGFWQARIGVGSYWYAQALASNLKTLNPVLTGNIEQLSLMKACQLKHVGDVNCSRDELSIHKYHLNCFPTKSSLGFISLICH